MFMGKKSSGDKLSLITSTLICWAIRPIYEFNARAGIRFKSHHPAGYI